QAELLGILSRANGFIERMGHSNNRAAIAQFCVKMEDSLDGIERLLGLSDSASSRINANRRAQLLSVFRREEKGRSEIGPFEEQHVLYADRILKHVNELLRDGIRVMPTETLVNAYTDARESYKELFARIG
ncbi:MAG: hypothetical protein KGH52_04475, partial [Candidatus Micrarchaeota archaeon]|nr:hypothetical protein [Candidatus Micrarchaeota archaeon]